MTNAEMSNDNMRPRTGSASSILVACIEWFYRYGMMWSQGIFRMHATLFAPSFRFLPPIICFLPCPLLNYRP